MTDLYAFLPDPARGVQADDAMHIGLADSFAHLAEATAQELPDLSATLTTLADRLRSGWRFPSLGFALYYRLARALMAGDADAARGLGTRIAGLPGRSLRRPLLITGTAEAAPLVELLATDDDPLLRFAPVPVPEAQAFAGLLAQASVLMGAHLSDLRGEIDAIVQEILLGHAQPGSAVEFDGASHYQYWGLLMLNPAHHRTPLAVVEVMAHESAHSLLFGLSIDEPLTLNPEGETYASPLRPDPRPMDGIYHATFVSARMAWAMERMAEATELSADDRAAAEKAAAADRANFAAGLQVVRGHGRLTTTGEAILANAEAWIAR